MRIKIFSVLLVVFAFCSISVAQVPGATETVYPITMSMQPSGSDTIAWSSGKYLTVARNGLARKSRGVEIKSTSSGGNLKIHLANDYNSKGQKVYIVYPIPASGGSTQRIGFVFDEVDSAGTTINKSDLIIWY